MTYNNPIHSLPLHLHSYYDSLNRLNNTQTTAVSSTDPEDQPIPLPEIDPYTNDCSYDSDTDSDTYFPENPILPTYRYIRSVPPSIVSSDAFSFPFPSVAEDYLPRILVITTSSKNPKKKGCHTRAIALRYLAMYHILKGKLPEKKPDFVIDTEWYHWKTDNTLSAQVKIIEISTNCFTVKLPTIYDKIVHGMVVCKKNEYNGNHSSIFRWWSQGSLLIKNKFTAQNELLKKSTAESEFVSRQFPLPVKLQSHPYFCYLVKKQTELLCVDQQANEKIKSAITHFMKQILETIEKTNPRMFSIETSQGPSRKDLKLPIGCRDISSLISKVTDATAEYWDTLCISPTESGVRDDASILM